MGAKLDLFYDQQMISVGDIKSDLESGKTSVISYFSCADDPTPMKFFGTVKFWAHPDRFTCLLKYMGLRPFVHRAIVSILDADSWAELASSEMFKSSVGGEALTYAVNYDLSEHPLSARGIKIQFDVFYGHPPTDLSSAMEVARDVDLPRDMLRLFESTDGADVTFIAQNEEIRAHKNILIARSDYFRSLFQSGMLEAQSNRVIVEAKADLFRELLKFLYTGLPPENLPAVAAELLPLADQYGIAKLKNLCCSALILKVTSKTAIEIYLLAEAHACEDVANLCLRVIKGNLKTLKMSETWSKLKENPVVAVRVLELFAE